MALKQIAPVETEALNPDPAEEPEHEEPEHEEPEQDESQSEELAASAERRSLANRANAQRSTGPRTPEGKARSRRNALRHGLFARTLAFAAEPLGEARAEFDALCADLVEHHQPQGPEEALLVERIATTWWLLGRLTAQGQHRLRELLDEGAPPLEALQESEGAGSAEARLERSLLRMHRNLAFLQKWRGDREQRSEQAAQKQAAQRRHERIAAYHAETEAQIQAGLRRSRERQAAEQQAAERREAEHAGQEAALADAALPDGSGDAAFEPLEEPLEEPEAALEDDAAGEETAARAVA